MKLIRIKELAEKLQMSKSGIRRLIKVGQLPEAMLIGDRIHVWNEETIDQWLEAKEGSSMSWNNLPHDKE